MTSNEIRAEMNALRERLVSLSADVNRFRNKLGREFATAHLGTQEDVVMRVALPQLALDGAGESLGHASARLIEARAHLALASAHLDDLGK